MTSSGFISITNKATMISSLPSPPASRQKTPISMVDRAPSFYYRDHSGSISDTRSTKRDVAELRSFLLNHPNEDHRYYLPPIQHVLHTPTSSPSPPFESYCTSSISSAASSPTSLDGDDVEEEDQRQKQFMVRRKGSIASLLNSDPELRQLDEEESKCNYLSHFIDNNKHTSLKRGRPRQDPIELIYNHSSKKQRRYNNANGNKTAAITEEVASTQSFSDQEVRSDCLQACQSQSNSNQRHVHSELASANEPTRATKGLRHFSKQVCDKVAEKRTTTYNEVADELAFDIQNSTGNDKHTYDQKNIRRRVYDALNVLMAMDIISKDKKVIKWLGIPDFFKKQESQDDQELLKQIEQEQIRQDELMGSLHVLRGTVNDKLQKHSQIRNLVSRNESNEQHISQRVALPFFMIACSTTTKEEDIHIDMSNDSRFATVSCKNQSVNDNRIVYEDADILKHLSLNNRLNKSTNSKKLVCSLLQQSYQHPS